jgi:hypothetical protein
LRRSHDGPHHGRRPAELGIEACRALDSVACAPCSPRSSPGPEEERLAVPGDPEVAAALPLVFLNEVAGLIAAVPSDRSLRDLAATVDDFLTRLFG